MRAIVDDIQNAFQCASTHVSLDERGLLFVASNGRTGVYAVFSEATADDCVRLDAAMSDVVKQHHGRYAIDRDEERGCVSVHLMLDVGRG